MKIFHGVALLIIFFFVACRLGQPKASVDSVILELVGSEVLDCGTVEPNGETAATDACAVAAFRAGKPFKATYQVQGIDSEVANIFVGGKGTLYRLSYDSDPCGGGGCGPSIQKYRCVKPKVVGSAKNVHLECS